MDAYQMLSSIKIKIFILQEGWKELDRKYFVQGNSHLFEVF